MPRRFDISVTELAGPDPMISIGEIVYDGAGNPLVLHAVRLKLQERLGEEDGERAVPSPQSHSTSVFVWYASVTATSSGIPPGGSVVL